MDFIPYGKQFITKDDIDAVVETLKSDMITQGPAIAEFEKSFASTVNVAYSSAVCNASAGLHIAYQATGLKKDDIVWTTPNTFVATANAALYTGAEIDFVDIDPNTFCMSIEALENKLVQAKKDNKLPNLVVPVHFAGQPCDMQLIFNLSKKYNFRIVEDASHAVGATYQGNPIGSCEYSDACVFSFHPVKIITTGEGGMITTSDKKVSSYLNMARTHGITKDNEIMESQNAEPWFYEQQFLGYNFRMTDIQAALGQSQLNTLQSNMERRKEIAKKYQTSFADLPLQLQAPVQNTNSSWHLFVLLFEDASMRRKAYDLLLQNNIGTQVHYIPVHTQPFYKRLGFSDGDFPQAEAYYKKCLSIPMFHNLEDEQQDKVIALIRRIF